MIHFLLTMQLVFSLLSIIIFNMCTRRLVYKRQSIRDKILDWEIMRQLKDKTCQIWGKFVETQLVQRSRCLLSNKLCVLCVGLVFRIWPRKRKDAWPDPACCLAALCVLCHIPKHEPGRYHMILLRPPVQNCHSMRHCDGNLIELSFCGELS